VSDLGITIDFPAKHSRLTTFFRLILVIPLVIFAYFYEIATFVAAIFAWIALLFTARYPKGLYDFVSGFVRFYMRFLSYYLLAVDAYPPFSGSESPEYPVHVSIPERKEHYSRLLVLFRIFYILPAYLIVAVLGILLYVLVILAWIIIVISGRLPGFIAKYMQFAFGWVLKFQALALLLVENY
jgi:hypothetical protein